MPSDIDPTKPADGVPANKAELRANLETARTELGHGGFADSFTPVHYGPPASAKVTDHLAAIDGAFGSLGGFTGLADTPTSYSLQASRFVKVKADESGLEFANAPGGSGGLTGYTDVIADHGAVGDGTTDDTTAIANALASGATVICFPPGTYKVTGTFTVPPGTMIVGAGPQKTIIDGRAAGEGNESAIFDCTGTLTNLPALSSSITAGNGSIAFSSSVSATLKHGDWVRIRDTTTNSLNVEGSNDGFYFMVNSAEGSTVYPATPCLRTLPAARTGGPLSNVESRKMDQRGLVMRDLTIWAKGFGATSTDSPINGIAVQCYNLANIYLDRVDILGGAAGAFQPRDCCNVHLIGCRFSVNQGDYNNAGAYALYCWGTGYLTASDCRFLSVRHATMLGPRNMPVHDVILTGCYVGSPGTDAFQQPTSTSVIALDWHEGTFRTKVIGCHVHGSVDFRGSDMSVEHCLIEGAASSATVVGTFSTWKINNLNMRVVDNDIIVRNTHWKGSGCLFELSDNDLNQDEGLPGSLLFANNRIRVEIDTTQALFRIHDTTAKSTHTGVIHIIGNTVTHSECSTSQTLLDIDVADMEELVVLNNVLPDNVSYGTTPDSASIDRYEACNVIDGHMVYDGLPTSSPGGSGRLWNDAGTLKIT